MRAAETLHGFDSRRLHSAAIDATDEPSRSRVAAVVHDSRSGVREVRDTRNAPNVVSTCRGDLQVE
jgi:hypothetical protein